MTDNGKDVVDVPAPATSRGRNPKQEDLPGQEPQPKIAAVHSAIEAYVEVRDERLPGRRSPRGGARGRIPARLVPFL